MTGTTGDLVVERRGSVLVVRLNRPASRNTLTQNIFSGIGAAVLDAESDPDTRVIVLVGTGDRAFCAGMDLREFADGADGFTADESAAAYDRLTRGRTTVPVVGAANGAAVGGGLELLLGCDIVVASRTAKFALPETKRGLFPGGGGTFIGTRIPLGIALELTLTGEPITAERAYEIGLVNAVVAPDQVLDTALRYADLIAGNAPLGVAAAKELVRLALSDTTAAEQRLGELQKSVFGSADAREGAMSFVEKRPPAWQGR